MWSTDKGYASRDFSADADVSSHAWVDILCVTDAEGRLTYISPSIRQYGYDPAELKSQLFLLLIAESDRKVFSDQLSEAVDKGKDIDGTYQLLTKGGASVQVGVSGTAEKNAVGDCCFIVMTVCDRSEHDGGTVRINHRAMIRMMQADLLERCLQLSGTDMDDALQETLRKLGKIIGADRGFIFRYDVEQNTISNTHEWCASGIEPQNAQLQNLSVDIFPWWMSRLKQFEFLHIPCVEDLPADAQAEKEILQQQEILSVAVAPIRWKDDLLGFIGLDFVRSLRECTLEEIKDIEMIANTLGLLFAQRIFEQSLRDQRNLYHTLVEDMPGLLNRYKPDGTLTFVNDEYCRIFGKTREELIGHSFMPLIPDEDHAVVRDSIALCSPSEPVVEYQNRVIMPDGSIRWFRWVDRALFDESGEITEYQSLGADITKTRNLEEQLAQSQKLETIGLLAGGIAHDFNNNLQSILGFTEMAMEKIPPESGGRDDLAEALTAVKLAQRLTRQLLAFSRQQPSNPEPLCLNELMRGQKRMLKRVLGEDIEVELDVAEDIMPIMVDPGQVEQVVLNLAVNARHAMPNGGHLGLRTANVVLDKETAEQQPDAKPHPYVCLAVSDTGCGMSPDVVERIFDPFFTTKRKGQGTGLGLSMVQGIVRQHQGWIHVYSQEGEGTTFKIYFPAATKGLSMEKPGHLSGLIGSTPITGNILVVEDEHHLGRLAARMLESAGHRVRVVTCAADARKSFAAEEGAYDVLFSDVVLGDGNGVDLALAFQENRPKLCVLFASGYADDRSRWRMIEEKGWKCLLKPYSKLDLIHSIQELLQQAKYSCRDLCG